MAGRDGLAKRQVKGPLEDAPSPPRRLHSAAWLLKRAHNRHVCNSEPPDLPRHVVDDPNADWIQVVRYKKHTIHISTRS